MGDPTVGEQIAAAVHGLLTRSECLPVLVLGTLWQDYVDDYTDLPSPGVLDPHSRVRELLAGRTVAVPEAFDEEALSTARALAEKGDRLLAETLTRAHTHGRVTQDLAGAPELLRRYEQATPAARAMLEAAMDARRLGVGLHLPQAFLTDAVVDYLSEWDIEGLSEDWAEAAFAELARPVHGKLAALRRVNWLPKRPALSTSSRRWQSQSTGPVFRLADYLDQHGRTLRHRICPPASFWEAALIHITNPADLVNLALQAGKRQRLQQSHHLWHRAAEGGSIDALRHLVFAPESVEYSADDPILMQQVMDLGDINLLRALARRREDAGLPRAAEALYWEALGISDASATGEVRRQASVQRCEDAEHLTRQVTDPGDADLLLEVALVRQRNGQHEAAAAFVQRAVELGSQPAQWELMKLREEAGDRLGAEALAQQAAESGNWGLLITLGQLREESGDRESADELYCLALGSGEFDPYWCLARLREESGDRAGAEEVAQQVPGVGAETILYNLMLQRQRTGDRAGLDDLAQRVVSRHTDFLFKVARIMKEVGNTARAVALFQQAADAGYVSALRELMELREEAGDRAGAEELAQQAANSGNPHLLTTLGRMREEAGNRNSAEQLYRQALAEGDEALWLLVRLREEAGDRAGAEELAQHAASSGSPHLLVYLGELREEAGDAESAEALFQQALDAGEDRALKLLAWLSEESGDQVRAEVLAQQAANSGTGSVLYGLALKRESAGDRAGAEPLARQVVDAAWPFVLLSKADLRRVGGKNLMPQHWWPHGLNPDGTATGRC